MTDLRQRVSGGVQPASPPPRSGGSHPAREMIRRGTDVSCAAAFPPGSPSFPARTGPVARRGSPGRIILPSNATGGAADGSGTASDAIGTASGGCGGQCSRHPTHCRSKNRTCARHPTHCWCENINCRSNPTNCPRENTNCWRENMTIYRQPTQWLSQNRNSCPVPGHCRRGKPPFACASRSAFRAVRSPLRFPGWVWLPQARRL